MNLSIKAARLLSLRFLSKLGLKNEEASIITDSLIAAELAGKSSHGLNSLLYLQSAISKINLRPEPIIIKRESRVTLLIDGRGKTGYVVLIQALNLAFNKIKQSPIVAVGLSNTGPMTGYVGYYAFQATEKNLIYLGWTNSPGMVAPFRTIKRLWGTNPITIGIPTNHEPIIHDMATASLTSGNVMQAIKTRQPLPPGTAIDDFGNSCTDPLKIWDKGALLPIAGHKGSGLSMINELLAGALTGSRAGFQVIGGLGSFFILIDPAAFRPLAEFKKDVDTFIKELKSVPKMPGVNEVYFPGEQSAIKRRTHLKTQSFELDGKIYQSIKEFIG